MLHTLSYETELFSKVFSLMESQRRKKLEHYVKDVVNKKQIFFPGGTRFPPNFFLKKSFHTTLVIEQLERNAFFRRGFATRMAEGLDKYFDDFIKRLTDGESIDTLILESATDESRTLPALVAVLLIEEKLTNDVAHRLLDAARLGEAPAIDTTPASVSPAPMRRVIEALKEVEEAVSHEDTAKRAAPGKVPVTAESPVKTEAIAASAATEATHANDTNHTADALSHAKRTTPELPADRLPEEKPLPDASREIATDQATAADALPAEREKRETQSDAALSLRDEKPAPRRRPVAHGPAKRFFDVEEKRAALPREPGLAMHRYLVYLRRAGNFTNAHMAAEQIGGVWTSNPEEYKHLFQSFGAVNLSSTSRITLPDGAFFVMDIDPHALEPNYDNVTRERRSDYCDRVDFNLLKREERFFDAADFGLYPVVYVDDRLGGEPDFERNVYVRFTPANEAAEANFHLKSVPVLLSWGKYFYGPVTVKEDAQSRPYVNFQFGTTKGLIPGFRRKESAVRVITQFCKPDANDTAAESFFHPVHVAETRGLTPVLCDVMTDASLMAKLVSAATSDRDSRDTMAQWLETNRASSELFTSDDRVREARFNRIAAILESADSDARFFDDIAALVSDTLDRSGTQGELYTKVVKRISETPELMRRLDSHRVIAAKLRELTDRRDQLEIEIRTMDAQAKKAAEAFRKEERKKNKTLIDENATLEKSLEDKRAKLDFLDTSADLLTLRSTLTDDISTLDRQKTLLSDQIDALGEQLENVARSASKYAFDGAVASKLLEAAAAYAGETQKKSALSRVEAVRDLPLSGYAKGQLADYLVRAVQQYREYDRNAILNLFICLTQSFLTVFAGGPGSGKTSICNIMGKVLGLTSIGDNVPEGLWDEAADANRYLPISVERGWTSKRDFVGYFNPLTKAFESVDDRRYDAFRQLDLEERRGVSKLPFVMMLDEANLSPMEYYWADFMNICDRRSELSYISLGDKAHYHVPDTLRFLATINNDHTTEILSPRLIDRATVITLPDVDWGALSARKPVTDFEPKLVSWSALTELFGPREIKAHKADISDLLDDLYERMAHAGFPVSARARLSIERYISAAAAVMGDDKQPAYAVAVDYALAQKLLPKLSGTGEDFRAWLEALKTWCESNGLDISLKLLDDMIRRGKASMGYYKFF